MVYCVCVLCTHRGCSYAQNLIDGVTHQMPEICTYYRGPDKHCLGHFCTYMISFSKQKKYAHTYIHIFKSRTNKTNGIEVKE